MTDDIGHLVHAPAIVPVVTFDDAAGAPALATALVAGGITSIEVTLRTVAGLDAIAALRDRTDIVVGAGTVRSADDVHAAVAAGARFVVCPGLADEIVSAAADLAVPVLPGIATGSELLEAWSLGLHHVKLFPAETLGGLDAVRALAAPFPEMSFMPSGGVSARNAREYLSHPAVFAISGSWMVPSDAMRARDWALVEQLSRKAVQQVATDEQ
ncbi:bifunctional 4-hydroxy-2-oxoglutarate aldolase/2-dehydro-3-deoxy-phosphogluconate aldolase [Microbacterium awajiense]|uniref:2-dehydro-3-deoxy-phosphogluconate aldolase n=1 Tax=Microbacterium awajiense TaxID=415214 RepID=A0ABP7AT29_9MICO